MANPQTSARVAGMATQSGAVNTSNVLLLGVFGPENAMQALIRMPSGRIRRVERGSRLNAGRVQGIDTDGLILVKNGQSSRLPLLD